ncbi:hypothetical protein PR202_gb20153 [Eleusine coracana subsp. coracana]|uniref:Reverse transcriptase zinc-binding domain-containing protein n=1 Tax=Eleusine coracana subsp. coracana TaxID=191504 RepID=A0AAV5F7T5_ELECO|nr:hypothetical protein PR202_gb20153 [Eleusine coracana subsp. coracana]
MDLESYDYELCLLQREETLRHLFITCNFAKQCWQTIGITMPRTLQPLQFISRVKRKLRVPFFMKIMILMVWCIWIKGMIGSSMEKTHQWKVVRALQKGNHLGYPSCESCTQKHNYGYG